MTTNAKGMPDLVHWYRGMLLMPEHFRAASARQEQLPAYLVQSVVPFAWGVRSGKPHIVGTDIVLRAIEAILPDGTLVAFDAAADGGPLQLSLKNSKLAIGPDTPIDVYLALAPWTRDSMDPDLTDSPAPPRFTEFPNRPAPGVAGDKAATDEEDALALTHGSWLRPQFTLVLGTAAEPPSGYTLLRIARLTLADGKMVEAPYEPPRLRIGEAELVLLRINELINDVYERAGQIAAPSDPAPAAARTTVSAPAGGEPRSAADRTSQDIINALRRWFDVTERRRALTRVLPRLQAMLHTGVSHPFDVYLALCDAAGEIGLAGGTLDLDRLPAYDHDDPLHSFETIIATIRQSLKPFDLRYHAVRFTRFGDATFKLKLKPEEVAAGQSLLIGVTGKPKTPRDAHRRWLSEALICLEAARGANRRRRVSGWKRTIGILGDPDLGVQQTTELLLARIAPDGDTGSEDAVDAVDAVDANAVAENVPVLVIESDAREGPVEIILYRPVPGAGAQPDGHATP